LGYQVFAGGLQPNHLQMEPSTTSRPGAVRWAVFPFGRPQSKPSSYIPLCSAVYVRRADNLPGLPETFHEVRMTAVVYQIRDYQSAKEIERMQRELEKEAAAILSETVPFGGQGIDGMVFTAPDSDPA
jgi:hypothetical protein